MNREQFMKQLSYLLQDISDEDRTDALDYYENYLDEAGFGYETDITNEARNGSQRLSGPVF